MADSKKISKIQFAGVEYQLYDQAAHDNASMPLHYLGITTTEMPTEDTVTVSSLVINGTTISNFSSGDVVLYGNNEYIYNGKVWQMFGPQHGELAFKSTVSITNGTVAGAAHTHTVATHTHQVTQSTINVSLDYKPTGTVSSSASSSAVLTPDTSVWTNGITASVTSRGMTSVLTSAPTSMYYFAPDNVRIGTSIVANATLDTPSDTVIKSYPGTSAAVFDGGTAPTYAGNYAATTNYLKASATGAAIGSSSTSFITSITPTTGSVLTGVNNTSIDATVKSVTVNPSGTTGTCASDSSFITGVVGNKQLYTVSVTDENLNFDAVSLEQGYVSIQALKSVSGGLTVKVADLGDLTSSSIAVITGVSGATGSAVTAVTASSLSALTSATISTQPTVSLTSSTVEATGALPYVTALTGSVYASGSTSITKTSTVWVLTGLGDPTTISVLTGASVSKAAEYAIVKTTSTVNSLQVAGTSVGSTTRWAQVSDDYKYTSIAALTELPSVTIPSGTTFEVGASTIQAHTGAIQSTFVGDTSTLKGSYTTNVQVAEGGTTITGGPSTTVTVGVSVS